MARPKILTKKELRERARNYINNRYKNDSDFREKERARARVNYRKKTPLRWVTYCHLCPSGLIYIGSGLITRAYDFTRRSKQWHNHFSKSNPPQVRIITECQTRLDALRLEQEFLDIIGLDNLINERNAYSNEV